MSHTIYHTRALILKTKNMRESNKLVYLYTERFGFIYASIQSVRELKSKMRYHLHLYSIVEIDLVSGRNIWRITGLNEIRSSFCFVNTKWYGLVSLFSDTLIRLCTGEERNEQLWNEIILFFNEIKEGDNNLLHEYEIIIMIRTLFTLGYWEEEDITLEVKGPYSENILNHVKKHKLKYIIKINDSFNDSQL